MLTNELTDEEIVDFAIGQLMQLRFDGEARRLRKLIDELKAELYRWRKIAYTPSNRLTPEMPAPGSGRLATEAPAVADVGRNPESK